MIVTPSYPTFLPWKDDHVGARNPVEEMARLATVELWSFPMIVRAKSSNAMLTDPPDQSTRMMGISKRGNRRRHGLPGN
jgi:hypothetical protein